LVTGIYYLPILFLIKKHYPSPTSAKNPSILCDRRSAPIADVIAAIELNRHGMVVSIPNVQHIAIQIRQGY
jgi:hypothetical protein